MSTQLYDDLHWSRGRMLPAPERQGSPTSMPCVDELSLGLLSLTLPWSRPEGQQNETLNFMGFSHSDDLDLPQAFQTPVCEGRGDSLERYPSLIPVLDTHSGSSSPVNSENSAVSSGSDYPVSFRVSPPLPLLFPDLHVDGATVDPDAQLEQNLLKPFTKNPGTTGQDSVMSYWTTPPVWPDWGILAINKPSFSIEREARLHKQAAAMNEATYTWEGQLPPRLHKSPVYSCKVFLGGVPWDITEASLLNTFGAFGPLKVAWPGKDGKHPRYPPQGYVYLLFDWEKSVKSLLQACAQHRFQSDDYLEFYFKLSSRRIHSKDVQVIPWVISESTFIRCPSQHLCRSKTVFVGALHGMLSAEGLAHIMNDLFGGVVYAGIDTDKHKYPIGLYSLYNVNSL
ncbi:hypothetical protein DNTS_027169 [Danionella cerebrum]|uniref:RRM domain-containing protein n=1 Tax=Danionella cerebrum TaxID=2873325 RepID=A0A553QKK0_9TELE|nr:hypothetical protein DNTS_027169 [Danionella translucida]